MEGGGVTISYDPLEEEDGNYRLLFDPGTGLPRGALVRDRLHMALQLVRRTGRMAGLFHVVVPEDCDGDAVALVAEELVRVVRPGDTVGRIGERNLLVVCQDLPYEEDAAPLVERLLTAVRESPRLVPPPDIVIGVAIGRHGADAGELLAEATRASAVATS
jgi:GGDEF domain-containing protein